MNLIIGGKAKESILVVALLRMGDIVMLSPALKNLRKQFPNANIEIMINENFKHFAPLIPFVNGVKYFPRQALQSALLDKNKSLFFSIDCLSEHVNKLDDYDICYNFTHNKLSSHMMELIPARKKIGLQISDESHCVTNNWLSYLNETRVLDTQHKFHYSDIFKFATGNSGSREFYLQGVKGLDDELFQEIDHEEFIVFQPLSSDEKKNFPMQSTLHVIDQFLKVKEDFGVYILSAPSETAYFKEILATVGVDDPRVKIIECGLPMAAAIIKKASLVVSVDTIYKHLASAANTDILEISLGSSEFGFTGVYNENSIIVSPQTDCYPCEHSSKCSNLLICQTQIPVDVISSLMVSILEKDIKISGNRYKSSGVSISKAQFSNLGFWYSVPLVGGEKIKSARQLISRYALHFMFEGQDELQIPPVGSYAIKLLKDLVSIGLDKSEILNLADSVNKESEEQENKYFKIQKRITMQIKQQLIRGEDVSI